MNTITASLSLEGQSQTLSLSNAVKRAYSLEEQGHDIVTVTTDGKVEYHVFFAEGPLEQ